MPRKTYQELKTVAEQAAFEFGNRFQGSTDAQQLKIARSYAFTHQYSAFPRSDDGYARLMAAFLSGSEFRGEIQ